MKSRALASIALGAVVALGTTGCSMLSTQSTTIQYSAADGMNIHNSGPLDVRNVLVVANARGTVGNLVAAVVNPTLEEHTLAIQVGEGTSAINVSLRVPAKTTLSLGKEEQPLRLEGIDTKPGATIPIYFQSGTAEGTRTAIPVLGGELDYLRDLVPTSPGDEIVIVEEGATPTPGPTTAAGTESGRSSGH